MGLADTLKWSGVMSPGGVFLVHRQPVLTSKGGCVRVGVSVAMLYKKGGLCTCWCISSDVVQERGTVYVLVYQ